ncbi:hypothetical protein HB884_05790 [Listeria booriae]|uniref:hypothetical protein n=1 Tax=Listeria booriae TaxID=1552123 RepID=UPI001625A32B|nr:hypothetical protein [Listeria booriae]MBC1523718.1 hypothetical protein [Listeria booriae]MBC6150128.1 hypothetical protein [Listeria booriae]
MIIKDVKSVDDLYLKGFEPLTQTDEEAIQDAELKGVQMDINVNEETDTNLIVTSEGVHIAEVMIAATRHSQIYGWHSK